MNDEMCKSRVGSRYINWSPIFSRMTIDRGRDSQFGNDHHYHQQQQLNPTIPTNDPVLSTL